MHRRTAVAWLGTVALAGCGGGGSGVSVAPSGGSATVTTAGSVIAVGPVTASTDTSTSVQATTPPPGASKNIAIWGDSLTPPVAANLQMLSANRQVYDGGVPGETSAQIAARQLADTVHSAWITVFWYGQNNPADPARIKADIAASVAALSPGNNRFLVLSVVNEALPEQLRGGAVYSGLMQLNSELATLYPGNFLDIRSFLVAHFDPTSAQDRLDAQNDVVPSSLRFDTIHLNNNGSLLVATRLKEFIDGKGW